MRRITTLFFLATLAAVAVAPRRADGVEPVELSVMTYNIKAATHRTDLTTEENLEAIAQVIEAYDPDILFAQEVMRFDPLVDNIDEFEWLRQRLGYDNARFASGQKDPVPPGAAEWGVATYVRPGSVVSSAKYRLESQGRVMLRVTASTHDITVHLFNTHLGGDQPEQVAKVADWLDNYLPLNEPIILGGDFNETPDSDELAPLRDILVNVFEGSAEQPIDSFFVSPGLDFFDVAVIPDPTEASDHDPSVFTWRVPEPPPILLADFDGDGDVDAFDLLRWQYGYGMGGTTHDEGDADLDGDVDAFDLLIWQYEFGGGPAAVPEPSTIMLLATAALALPRFTRRRR
jgi:endonuclease/exonuclease/phosphatase family metal-dependent hydrolase